MSEVIERILNGEASAEELAGFLQAAESDPALRQELAEHTALEGLLGVALESIEASRSIQSRTIDAINDADRAHFAEGVVRRVERRRTIQRMLALAAVVLLCFAGWRLIQVDRQREVRIVRVESLSESDRKWESIDRLERGQRLSFHSGLMELQVGRKGKMILEGPADIEFPENDRAVVHRGQVVMEVTREGRGFVVDTPQGKLVDLGTEFGVSVALNGESKIHVLDGEVEAKPNGGKKILLRRSEALNLSEGGSKIPAQAGDFYTSLPPVNQRPDNFVHWPLDVVENSASPSIGRGFDKVPSKELRLLAISGGSKPKEIEGAMGRALEFDGKGGFAESAFRGIGGGQSRTVSFWVRVPEDFSVNEGFGIVSWGTFTGTRAGEAWQIAVNPTRADGQIGRLRVGTSEGKIIGTKDLRDGRWHHVAVVLYGGSQPDIGTHVLVYIDGGLEEISARTLTTIRTDVDTTRHGVWIGRNLTRYWESGSPQGGFFRGGIDEVYIFDAALSQKEIDALRTRNP